MKKRINFKKCVCILTATVITIIATSCTMKVNHQKVEITGFSVTAIDVGKADSLILQTGSSVTVVDTGCKENGEEIQEMLSQQGINKIDKLIITHFDKDHVGGASKLAKKFEIGEIYTPDYNPETKAYEKFMKQVGKNNLSLNVMKAQTTSEWTADNAEFKLFAPNKADYENKNDYSLCLYVKYGNTTFLFAGDAMEERQQEILSLNLGKVDFLKFPYHGRYLETTEKFLDTTSPKYAVVCCSQEQDAESQTLEAFKKHNSNAYYTKNGTVKFISNGKEISVEQT